MLKIDELHHRKKQADEFWNRVYAHFQETGEKDYLFHAMDMCNRIEKALLDEESINRSFDILKDEVDYNSPENLALEEKRLCILQILKELKAK